MMRKLTSMLISKDSNVLRAVFERKYRTPPTSKPFSKYNPSDLASGAIFNLPFTKIMVATARKAWLQRAEMQHPKAPYNGIKQRFKIILMNTAARFR
jgi:hypothetical protein